MVQLDIDQKAAIYGEASSQSGHLINVARRQSGKGKGAIRIDT